MSNVIVHADSTKETSTTTGTGSLTLAGAVSNCQAFSDSFSTGDCVIYRIQHSTAAEWEVGLGTFTAPSTLARTTVAASSNSGSAVDLSAGTKYVSVVVSGEELTALDKMACHIFKEEAADGAASDTRVARVFYAPVAMRVLTLGLVMDAAVTGHASNYKTFDVKKHADGGAISSALATQITTQNTPAGDIAARTKKAFTLTGGKIDLAAGDMLVLDVGVAASGVQLPKFEVVGTAQLLY